MKNKTSAIGIIVAIIILIVIVIISNINTSQAKAVQTVASKIFMPMQNGVVYLKNKITGSNIQISDMEKLKKQNSDLSNENVKLKEQVRELEILKSENDTLKEYLGLKDKYTDYSTVPAYVVERSYSNYDKIIVINSGSKDGIKENMPVISESGLVGHIISTTEDTAKVQTIIDTASTVSASVSTTAESILLKGELGKNDSIKASYIPTEASLLQGDQVVTSGLGGIYPKGILIGTINDVVNTKNESDRYANVTTSTNFDSLDTVLVITNS